MHGRTLGNAIMQIKTVQGHRGSVYLWSVYGISSAGLPSVRVGSKKILPIESEKTLEGVKLSMSVHLPAAAS